MTYKIGYARVSRDSQTTEQQIKALQKEGCEEIFQETGSGANRARPKLAEALARARKGDTLVIWKLDRLARSITHLIEIAANLKERGIQLKSLTDEIDTGTASGKLLFHMLASIAEFERDLIRERTMAGLDRARAAGKIGGRPKTDERKIEHGLALLRSGLSYGKAAELAGVGKTTLFKAANRSENVETDAENVVEFRNSKRTVKVNGKPDLKVIG